MQARLFYFTLFLVVHIDKTSELNLGPFFGIINEEESM